MKGAQYGGRTRGFSAAVLVFGLVLLAGCSAYQLTSYNDVTETNFVEVTLLSGRRVRGTVLKAEPHQLTLYQRYYKPRIVPKSTIRTIKRKTPVHDEFGNGISEEEIQAVQTNRNAIIYGLGGGILGFGGSFFLSSTVAHADESAATIVPVATMSGGSLLTYLFVRAGKARDREDAILLMQDIRREEKLNNLKKEKTSSKDLMDEIEKEKIHQEELRKQREQILKELQKKNK